MMERYSVNTRTNIQNQLVYKLKERNEQLHQENS